MGTDKTTYDNCLVSRAEALLFGAQFFGQSAESGCYFVGILGVVTYTLGSSAFGVALTLLISNTALILGYVFAGPAIDTLGPRRVLVGAALAIAGVNLGYQAMPDTLTSLCLVVAARGFLLGFQVTAFMAYPPYVVGPELLHRANGLLGTANFAAHIAGPFVGGLVVMGSPPRMVFAFGAVLELLTAAIGWFLREDEAATERVAAERARAREDGQAEPQGIRAALDYAWEGVRVTMASPALRTLLLMGFAAFFAFGAFDSLESLYYRDVLVVGPEWLGWLSAASGVGTLAGALAMLKLPERWLNLRGVAVMLIVVGVGTVLYVGTRSVWVACAGQVVLGLGFGALDPTQNLLVQRLADLSVVGRVLSVVKMGYRFAGVVPLMAAPFLAEAFGVQPVLVGAGVVVLVAGIGFFIGIRPQVGQASKTVEESEGAGE